MSAHLPGLQRPRRWIVCGLVAGLLAAPFAPSASAQAALAYQNRGTRYEGVRPQAVSGYDIELLSARIDHQESLEALPDTAKIRFFLEAGTDVHVTVREVEYRHYYWLDRVRPARAWGAGFDNTFEWPTRDVLAHLSSIGLYDLGIVARLGRAEPGRMEAVAPVVLYGSDPPASVDGYLFTFRTRDDARIRSAIYRGDKDIYSVDFPRQSGGRPFTIRWDSSGAASGPYRLVVRGYSLENNRPIDLAVDFFHQPSIE